MQSSIWTFSALFTQLLYCVITHKSGISDTYFIFFNKKTEYIYILPSQGCNCEYLFFISLSALLWYLLYNYAFNNDITQDIYIFPVIPTVIHQVQTISHTDFIKISEFSTFEYMISGKSPIYAYNNFYMQYGANRR